MPPRLIAPCLVVLLFAASSAVGQQDAQDIVKKAIAAEGGAEKIDKYKGLKTTAKGTAEMSGIALNFSSETTIALPDKMRVVGEYSALGKTYTVVQQSIGGQVSYKVDGELQALTKDQEAKIKDAFVQTEIVRLTPLLADKQFTLKALPATKADGKEYVGVSVSGKGVKEMKLYFDRSTSLLSHYETVTQINKRDMKRVTTLSNYKDVLGMKRPQRMTVTLNGRTVMEVAVTEDKLSEKPEDDFKD